MNTTKRIVSSLFVVLIAVFAVFITWGVGGAKKVRLHVKDLSEHKLRIISPTDASFDGELTNLGIKKNSKEEQLVESLKPFSVILRNEGSRDVVAYRMRWDSIRPDGTTTTHVRTYAEPERFMGRGIYSSSDTSNDSGISIKAKSTRYVSVASSIGKQEEAGDTAGIQGGTGGNSSGSVDASRIQQMGVERNERALIDVLGTELAQSESLTVTLDAAVFDDGTFVGPDSLNYFERLQATIQAKRDLLSDALSAVQQNRPLNDVFNDIKSLAEKNVAVPQSPGPSDSYEFHKKEFAKEILRIRAAMGDDKLALWRITRPFYRNWTKVRKRPR